MNTATASFYTTLRKMTKITQQKITEMSQRKKADAGHCSQQT